MEMKYEGKKVNPPLERLTQRDRKGRAYFDDDGVLIRGANGAFHQKKDMTNQFIHQRFVALDKAIDRLAAYEDTGLEPCDYNTIRAAIEQVDKATKELSEMSHIVGETRIDHLRELVQAKKDGRLVVLPCKVGATVWAITSPINMPGMDSGEEQLAIFDCTVESVSLYAPAGTQFRLYYRGKFVAWHVSAADFGKTVFLTLEEAETALAKMSEDT